MEGEDLFGQSNADNLGLPILSEQFSNGTDNQAFKIVFYISLHI